MRLVVQEQALRTILAWSQRLLFAGAIVLLGYGGYVLADTWLFQRRESRQFERLLDQRQALTVPAALTGQPALAGLSGAGLLGAGLLGAGLLGRLEIERLGVSTMVVEGAGQRTLRRAVGHIPGTSLPGQNGNVALTGHRDTFFRPLRNVRRDDVITFTTLEGRYRYRVLSTQVVSPENVWILDRGSSEMLTLITCHPFYYVGAAPNRFIVRAERVN